MDWPALHFSPAFNYTFQSLFLRSVKEGDIWVGKSFTTEDPGHDAFQSPGCKLKNKHLRSVLSPAACTAVLQCAAGPTVLDQNTKQITSDPWPLALISSDHINNNLFKFFLETDIKIAPVVTLSIFPTHTAPVSLHFTSVWFFHTGLHLTRSRTRSRN